MTQPHAFRPTPLALAVGAAISLSGAPALAADRAGRVLTSVGPVVARTDDGSTRSLSRGDLIYAGDEILTSRGRIQIRFRDGALVSLDPRTRFEVERYDTAEEEDEGGSAVMRLFRGALRTITGAIGDDPEDTYRMNTPVATVGVRGTQYALTYCSDGSCGGGVPDGLYGHVIDEGVAVDNAGGSGSFPSGAYFRVPDGDTPPQRILRPPGDLFRGGNAPDDGDEGDIEGPDGGGGGDDDETADTTAALEGDDTVTGEFSESSETGVAAEDNVDGQQNQGPSFTTLTNAGFAGGYAGVDQSSNPAADGGACISNAQCPVDVDGNGNVRLVDLTSMSVDATDPGLTLVESGSVPALDVTWGRWDGDIVVDDGNTQKTVTGGFPWAYSQNPTSGTELESFFNTNLGGTLFYTMSGGPSPVGTVQGDAWSVTNFSITLDITTGGLGELNSFNDIDLQLFDGSNTQTFAYDDVVTTTVDPSSGETGFAAGLVGSGGPGSGTLEAVFAGNNGEGMVVQFDVDDTTEVITGVKILER